MYQTEAAPPATISAPSEMIALAGAPVTGRAWPALTPPPVLELGAGVAPWTLVLGVVAVEVVGTVATCADGVVVLGAGLVGLVVAGVVAGVVGVVAYPPWPRVCPPLGVVVPAPVAVPP